MNIFLYSQIIQSQPCATDEIINAEIIKNPQLKLMHDYMNEKIGKLTQNGLFGYTNLAYSWS
jgi:hypothetical protein